MTKKGLRLLLALSLAGLTAGCFQPLYGDRSVGDMHNVRDKMGAVEIVPIDAPNGTRLARVGVELRDKLLFELTGGGPAQSAAYRLDIKLSASQVQVIVDLDSARPDIQNYGINASYTLTEIATGEKVVTGSTFSRVSYNIPGQQQRFAGDRGLRDAENRATSVIVDNIRSRLASYFAAGA